MGFRSLSLYIIIIIGHCPLYVHKGLSWFNKLIYYYYAFIKRSTSGLKTCSETPTRHLVQNKVNIKISNYAAAKNITK